MNPLDQRFLKHRRYPRHHARDARTSAPKGAGPRKSLRKGRITGSAAKGALANGGSGLVGHAGGILLRKLAEVRADRRAGRGTDPEGKVPAAHREGDIAVLGQLSPVLGPAPSGSTVRRVLDLATDRTLARIAQARARIRGHVWAQIGRGRVPGSSTWTPPWSPRTRTNREHLSTWKMGWGFHPLGAWAANTRECLAMLCARQRGLEHLHRPKEVLAAALKQVPAAFRRGSWSASTAPGPATSSSSTCSP